MFHLIFAFIFLLSVNNSNGTNTFIALVDPLSKPSPFLRHDHWYASIISSSYYYPASSSSSIIHVYNAPIHGFSATLTHDQVKSIRKHPGILSLFPDRVLHLHTTRSPSFLGLQNTNPSFPNTSESNTIIGFIDTGIWPEHPSFSDHNLGPIPVHWKGQCKNGFKFNRTNCNRKIIGATFFSGGYDAWFGQSDKRFKEFRSPRDSDGHGTHVASIAAGSPVTGSGFFGFAAGLARGIAPRARIAVYKVCWASGCLLSDICKAFETAIADGVDIISLSLGSSRLPFYLDLVAIVSFRAFSKGIFIAASAGNGGPTLASVANEPPWITTVGAGTIDRDFPATIHLKNNVALLGTSITLMPNDKLARKFYPLHFVGKFNSSPKFNISRRSIEGKIVFYRTEGHVSRLSFGAVLKRAGAIAMIISHGDIDPNGIVSEPHVIPTISIGVLEAKGIENYILSNENAMAKISSQGTIPMHAKPAPIVASFSSRGPNSLVPGILKPDIIAPGVNILGAWTGAVGPSGLKSDHRRSRFNVMSGTSMACPHVSGAAALIKSEHPHWGPNEIKSALMTTSIVRKRYYNRKKPFSGSSPISDESSGNAATPFELGSGHMLPIKAMNPGLVFDLEEQDYVNFLCQLNYTKKQLQIITGQKSSCSNDGTWQLNYPAVAVEAEKVRHGAVEVARKMTNVDAFSREYKAKIVGPKGYYKVDVKPKKLKFSGVPHRLSFRIFIEKENSVQEMKNLWFGAVIWREKLGKHNVKCPIVIFSATQYILN
ncbi:hypothetical protein DITRI_Ditri10aG0181600 [Diplodiscus trichospermus]